MIAFDPISTVNRLCEWLGATTQYPDLKEDLDRSWPNYDEPPKWRLFYQYGPVLVPNEGGLLDPDGKATGLKIAIKSVCYDRAVQAGEIIQSANGRKYMVQTSGAIRKI